MIGVLALQGDYEKHTRILKEINISCMEIRYPDQLNNIDGLIIPGGESTTMNDLMLRVDFHKHLIKFSQHKPIMGTCAGLIMMSKSIRNNEYIKPLGILDIVLSELCLVLLLGFELNTTFDHQTSLGAPSSSLASVALWAL